VVRAGLSEAQNAFVAHPLEHMRKATGAKSHGIGVGEGAFKGSTESREAFPGHVVRKQTGTCGLAWCIDTVLDIQPAVVAFC
jgi:hypothetical protein